MTDPMTKTDESQAAKRVDEPQAVKRLEVVHREMRRIFTETPCDDQLRLLFATHMHAVSNVASMLALRRGFDPELAAIAGALHDIASFKTGSFDHHGERGAVMARELLRKLEITAEEETELICHAIHNHNYKERVDEPFDELLKDADVWQHCFYDVGKLPEEKERARFAALCIELGLSHPQEQHV